MNKGWSALLIFHLLLISGCRVSKSGSTESEMANQVKHKITVGGKDTVNPIPATNASITEGREHFGHHCQICHGLDGEATGVPLVEWNVLGAAPKLKVLPGERRRERVITQEEEARYLAAAPDLLASIASVLVDTGMRPEECFRLVWEHITWHSGRNGVLLIPSGKSAAARRVIPMTARVRSILQSRWEGAGKPEDGWVWPAQTKSGHVEPSSLRKQHEAAFRALAEDAARSNEKFVRPLVLYSLRHTFLTRLGQSGCDAWTLARIAGHSSIAISARYVHPSEDAVLDAMSRLGGHKMGHSPNAPLS